jgi:nucleoid DNA-binding protein
MVRKKKLIKQLQEKLKLKSFKEAENIFFKVNEIYANGLKEEGSINFYGIGIISVGRKKARNIKVPRLSEPVSVPDRNGLFFKANKKFEGSLN